MCHSLALQIVADGEGASHVIEIEVRGASSDQAAERVARTIAGSALVKTMFAGQIRIGVASSQRPGGRELSSIRARQTSIWGAF